MNHLNTPVVGRAILSSFIQIQTLQLNDLPISLSELGTESVKVLIQTFNLGVLMWSVNLILTDLLHSSLTSCP